MDEATLVAMATRQHGVVTRSQANDAGISDTAIKRRVQAGRWRRLRPGVYVVGGAPSTWYQQVMGACLAGGGDVMASHRTATRLWGLVAADGRTELLVAGDRRVRLPGTRIHQSILLPSIDRSHVQGIPTTSLARTIADVASHQDLRTVGGWIDEAIRVHGLDLLELRSCLARLSGPGRRDLRPVRDALAVRLPGWDPGDSILEAEALLALREAGLPMPVQQHPVRRQDGSTAFIDLAYPWAMVAIELDGWAYHGRRSAFDPDRIRRNELTLLGWDVYQFTASTPAARLAATIGAALARASRPQAS